MTTYKTSEEEFINELEAVIKDNTRLCQLVDDVVRKWLSYDKGGCKGWRY